MNKELRKIAQEISQIRRQLTAGKLSPEIKKKIDKLINWEVEHQRKSLQEIVNSLSYGMYDDAEDLIEDAKYFMAGNWHNELHNAYSQSKEYDNMMSGIGEQDDGSMELYEKLIRQKVVPVFKKWFPVIAEQVKELDPSFKYKPNFDPDDY